jgi:hypothetical protein
MKFTSSNFKGLQKQAWYEPYEDVDFNGPAPAFDKVPFFQDTPWALGSTALAMMRPGLAKAIVPFNIYNAIKEDKPHSAIPEAYYGLGWMFPSIDKKVQGVYDKIGDKIFRGRYSKPVFDKNVQKQYAKAIKKLHKGLKFNNGVWTKVNKKGISEVVDAAALNAARNKIKSSVIGKNYKYLAKPSIINRLPGRLAALTAFMALPTFLEMKSDSKKRRDAILNNHVNKSNNRNANYIFSDTKKDIFGRS